MFGAACGLLAAYLLSPALTSVHVEGFSGQIQSLSQALIHGGISSHDPYLPAITEFIFLTRAGVVDLLALLRTTLGLNGDVAFRMLTIVSLALLLASSVTFAGNRGSVRVVPAFAALVLTPGVIETGFFFNDNIVSAGFASLALACLSPAAGLWRYLLAGSFAGIAVLCRLDGVFALPLLLGVVLIEVPPRPLAAVWRIIALLAGFLVSMAVAAAVNHATLLDSLTIGRLFNHVQQAGYDLRLSVYALLYFFGPITPLLLVIGIARKAQTGIIIRHWIDGAFFVLYPVLLCAFAVKSGREIRYLYPLLTPVIALHGGRGIDWLLNEVRRPLAERRGLLPLIVAGVVTVTFFTPPAAISMADGPRAMVGRMWSPVMWRRWQHTVNSSMARLDGFVNQLDREPAPLVITSHWNDEFYVRLRLSERGYGNSTAAETFPGCDGFSVYTRGQHRIMHLRLHNEYYLAPYTNTTYGSLAIVRAVQCPAMEGVTGAWVTTFGSQGDKTIDPVLIGFGYERFHQPLEVYFAHDWLRSRVSNKGEVGQLRCCADGLFDAVRITPDERATIVSNAKAIALTAATEAHTTPDVLFAAGRDANRGHTPLTHDRWP